MSKKYPHLLSPLVLGNVILRNRIVAAPQSLQKMDLKDLPRENERSFFECKAEGGFSIVSLGDCIVDSLSGKAHPKRVCLDTDECIPPIHEIAAAIRRHGAVAAIEINHAGKFANSNTFSMEATGLPIYGPMYEELPGGLICQQMDEARIRDTISSYARAARRAKQAGFQMINLHGAHGWLITQFMSEATNKRDDQWGGSFENRMRFVDEVIAAVRKEVGKKYPLEIRICGKEHLPGGYDIEEGIRIAKHLEDKVDLINISAGNHEYMEAMLTFLSDMFKPEAHLLEMAAAVKKEVSVPVSTVGGFSDPELMEEVIATGKADLIEMGRGSVADPFFPRKIMMHQEKELLRCMRCDACVGEECEPHHELTCAINPRIGKEFDRREKESTNDPKKILVAGGGPAGMEFAVTAARRGHNVTVCEKEPDTGGLLRCEQKVPFKKNAYEFSRTQRFLADKYGVTVLTGTEVTPSYVESFKPDVLVAAIGSEDIIPPIPGAGLPNVILATKLTEDLSELGERVVILGGGLVGAETAIYLAKKGKQVTVVEAKDIIAEDANAMHQPAIHFQFRDLKIDQATGVMGTRIETKGLYGTDKDDNECFFPADTVILAAGMKPKWDEVIELSSCTDEFYIIGDCRQVGKIKDATAEGWQLALNL